MIPLSLALLLTSALVTALALVQWGVAQRRERLYFYLTLERPGSGYFRDARDRREQFSRMAAAMALLMLANLGTLARPWSAPATAESATLLWLQVLGLALLAHALLPGDYRRRAATAGALSVAMLVTAGAMLALLAGWQSEASSLIWARRAQILLAVGVFVVVRRLPAKQYPLPPAAFLLWLVGPVTVIPALRLTAMAAFYALLGARLFLAMLDRYEQLETSHHRMQRQREVIVGFLERVGGAHGSALDLEQVLRIIVAAGVETTGAGAGAIYLLDPRTRTLQMRAAEGPFPPLYRDVPGANLMRRWEELTKIAHRQRFDLEEGVVGQVAASGQALRLADAQGAGVLVNSVCDPVRRHPMLLVPLLLREQSIGVMAVLNKRNADEFSVEDQLLLGTLAEQAGFYIDNARMVASLAAQERVQRELQIARDIQRLLLPAQPPALPGLELGAINHPALEMGGDYYDFFWVGEGLLGIVVADVSGKGVPAALTMAMLRTVMRSHAIGNRCVRATLTLANRSLYEDLRRDTFITVCYGILDVSRRTLTWARAGHEPILLVRGGQVEAHAPAGAAIGVLPPADFDRDLEVEELSLQPGDAVVIYTDGITEAMNSTNEEFGQERLLQVLGGHGHASSSDRIEGLQRAINAFVGDAPQQDDITLVVLTA